MAIPVFSHVVMVIHENHGYGQIIGSTAAPYINHVANEGALFTNSHGGPDVLHPSFPNYMQLFSGATQGVTNDTCPPAGQPYSAANLQSALAAVGKTFKGFAENNPTSRTACGPAPYAGRHVPWEWFSSVPNSQVLDFSQFPTTTAGYAALPTVSLVTPNLNNDMHDGTIQQGDAWTQANLDGYYQWAKTNNSLFIIQFDEDNFTTSDHIPTIFAGANVKPGQYPELINHYNVLHTLTSMYGAPAPGKCGTFAVIADCWTSSPPPPPVALQITTTSIPAATAGTFYTTTIAASGGTTPYTWSVGAGLPSGVTINASTGVLSGTPLNAGAFPFTVTVKDAGSPQQSASQPLTLTVTSGPPPPPGPITITTTSLPNGQVGTPYSATLTATGGTPPYTWSFTGTLPPGLALTGNTISGTPATAGTFNITVRAVDTASQSATKPLSIVVGTQPPPPPPPPSGNPLPMGAGVLTTLLASDTFAPTTLDQFGVVAFQDVTS